MKTKIYKTLIVENETGFKKILFAEKYIAENQFKKKNSRKVTIISIVVNPKVIDPTFKNDFDVNVFELKPKNHIVENIFHVK